MSARTNCRHSINLWCVGDPLPEPIDNSETERRYKLEQQQRALEREIRKAKRKVEGFTDPENIAMAKAQLRDKQKQLREFIDKTNADEGAEVLRRDYEREKVYDDNVNNKSVDNGEKSGIINEKEESPRKSKDGINAVKWDKIQSEEYSKKFKKLSPNDAIAHAIETRAKWALNNRDGTDTEELYAISLKDGREVARITDQHCKSGVRRTPKFIRELNLADETGEEVLLLHNHPRGLPPSISDINALSDNKNVSGITVGFDGSIYRYTKPNKIISKRDWTTALRRYNRYSEVTSMEKALSDLSSKYEFEFEML